MAVSLICANCHKTMVTANPDFCPFCGKPFVAAAPQSPPGNSSPWQERQGIAQGVLPIYANTSPQAPQRNIPILKTTNSRGLIVTLSVIGAILIAATLMRNAFLNVDAGVDATFFSLVTGHHYGEDLGGVVFDYPAAMLLVAMIAPMAVVIAYWFSLRRLFQEWALQVWLKTILLTALFLPFALIVAGGQLAAQGSFTQGNFVIPDDRWWILAFISAFPSFLLFLIAVAGLASVAGILFARFFARWPIERIRLLHGPWLLDATLTALSGFIGVVTQIAIYRILAPDSFGAGIWWAPLAAIVVAGTACWLALRPVNATAPRQR